MSLRGTPESLTPVHADLIMLCLLDRKYSHARKILDQTILEIHPNRTGVTPKDYLLYYYYGGMVYIGLTQFERAFEFLQTCITTPCVTTLNAIMVEAFKKFVFVSLILHGKFAGVPRQSSGVVQRSIRKMCQEYVDVAQAYGKRDQEKMQKLVTEHRAVFVADRMIGLLGQVQAAYTRQAILRLTQTYVTLSLADIQKAVGVSSPEVVESILLEMTDRKELKALINKNDAMVSFVDADASEAVEHLEAAILHVRKSMERIRRVEDSVLVSTEFQLKLLYKDPKLKQEILELEEKIRKKGLLSKMTEMLQ